MRRVLVATLSAVSVLAPAVVNAATILWERKAVGLPNGGITEWEYGRLSPHDSMRRCLTEAEATARKYGNNFKDRKNTRIHYGRGTGYVSVAVESRESNDVTRMDLVIRLECWPDTVDPRK